MGRRVRENNFMEGSYPLKVVGIMITITGCKPQDPESPCDDSHVSQGFEENINSNRHHLCLPTLMTIFSPPSVGIPKNGTVSKQKNAKAIVGVCAPLSHPYLPLISL
jgi:hypothetical protein